jgi:long-subunit acyl-CoA synthetase (AMP-forming)
MVKVRPTLMTAVPRVFEKLDARIHETVAHAPAISSCRTFRHSSAGSPPWAARGGTRDALAARADVVALFQEPVDAVNAPLAPFETIKRFALIPSEFTIAGGEVTPTMKVKRRVVEERWQALIEKLYEEDGPPIGVAT